MNIFLKKATKEDKEIVQNLGRFYVYDMSRYCGFLSGWETPINGLFECIDLSEYWTKPDRHPFLIHVDQELAGFVLVNKIGSSVEVNWNMGQFFVVSKFQRKGIGRKAAEQVFKKFPGIWEVAQIPENLGAIDFWQKVVDSYTKGNFHTSHKIIPNPTPHPMIVLKFENEF